MPTDPSDLGVNFEFNDPPNLWALGGAIVLVILGLLVREWLKVRRIRSIVKKCMAEHKEWRKTQVECSNCLHGKTWRPEALAGNVDLDSPLLMDCDKCNGSGLLPRKNLC